MSLQLRLQESQRKGDGGCGKKLSLHRFPADQNIGSVSMGGKGFFGILWHEQQILACCQTHYDNGPSKVTLTLVL